MSAGSPSLELRVARGADERVRLLAPAVGLFTKPPALGQVLVPGQSVGVLIALGRAVELLVPEGVLGRVAVEPDERVHRPVGYEDVLLELEPLSAGAGGALAKGGAPGAETARTDLILRASQPGRFYQRPSPGEPTFVAAGDAVEKGTPIGLLEIMKTFHRVPYFPGKGLPERARVVRYLVQDGDDVDEGAPLLEVAPAE